MYYRVRRRCTSSYNRGTRRTHCTLLVVHRHRVVPPAHKKNTQTARLNCIIIIFFFFRYLYVYVYIIYSCCYLFIIMLCDTLTTEKKKETERRDRKGERAGAANAATSARVGSRACTGLQQQQWRRWQRRLSLSLSLSRRVGRTARRGW